MKISEVNQD